MPSKKRLEMKKKQVDALAKELEKAESIVLTDYKGLTVEQDTEMRAEFRRQGLAYKVVKNSITERAFAKLGIEGLGETLIGPTALAYSTEDVVLAPRLIRQHTEKFRKMSIKGGVIGTEVYPLDKIMALSRIESRESLYGQLLFMMMYPLTAFAQVTAQIAEKAAEAAGEPTEEVEAKEEVKQEAAPEPAEAAEAETVTEEEKEEEIGVAEESPTSKEEEITNG